MNSKELNLMKEFNRLEREFEDFLMIEINDVVSKSVDERGIEKYNTVQKMCKEINIMLKKIADYNSLEANMDEFSRRVNEFYDTVDEIVGYFQNSDGVIKEILEIIQPIIEPKMCLMIGIQNECKVIGLNKVSCAMQLSIKKMRETMSYLLQEIVLGATREYKNPIVEEFVAIDIKLKEKMKEIESYESKEDAKEIAHRKLEKILDCNKMDDFLTRLGYEPIRQNGGHKIYGKGSNSIPVPQHSKFDKNLGYEIQKQI